MTAIIYESGDPRLVALYQDDSHLKTADDFDFPMSYGMRRHIAKKYDGVDLPPLAEDVEYERDMARRMARVEEVKMAMQQKVRPVSAPPKPPPPKPRPAPPASKGPPEYEDITDRMS